MVEGTDAAIAATQAALAAGQVVAVKGLGGYHLGVRRHLGHGGGDVARPQGARRQALRRDGRRRGTANIMADVSPEPRRPC